MANYIFDEQLKNGICLLLIFIFFLLSHAFIKRMREMLEREVGSEAPERRLLVDFLNVHPSPWNVYFKDGFQQGVIPCKITKNK